ncbi:MULTISPECIES: YbgA family protein [unclassified Endozoicomonas]|uniref:YbgA family protein n=1 Tax=unclassified Endozoicomonas TaxID=2644528 RepID=UPI003BB562DB
MAIVSIPEPEKQITLGISSCLLGHKVRYNGGHKRSSFCVNTLDKFFHFEPVCPEMAIGLGTPREPIRLVGQLAEASQTTGQSSSSAPDKQLQIRVVGTENSSLDVTDALTQYGHDMSDQLSHICGYILMQKSPSCGMARVKVYHENGHPLGESSPGAYARAFMESNPLLPIEEEGRLHDPILCENFFTRVYAYDRWQKTVMAEPSYAALVDFHSTHKYMIMAHYPQGYELLGQIVAKGSKANLHELLEEYLRSFMSALKRRANRKSHTNAMMHILGYVKKSVDGKERKQLLTLIEEYRQEMIPLIAPMTMLRHFIDNHGSVYIQRQTYLTPHPDQLGLRNRI